MKLWLMVKKDSYAHALKLLLSKQLVSYFHNRSQDMQHPELNLIQGSMLYIILTNFHVIWVVIELQSSSDDIKYSASLLLNSEQSTNAAKYEESILKLKNCVCFISLLIHFICQNILIYILSVKYSSLLIFNFYFLLLVCKNLFKSEYLLTFSNYREQIT